MSAAIVTKLDYDVIQEAESFINPIKDRELNLRNLKIAQIENLILTKDQNEVIDLTDNEIRILDNFPKMLRLKTLLLVQNLCIINNMKSGNRIARIDFSLAKYLPNLQTLMLNNNHLTELGKYLELPNFGLGDLLPLEQLTKLKFLSLIDNPLTAHKYYQSFVVYKLPSVAVIFIFNLLIRS